MRFILKIRVSSGFIPWQKLNRRHRRGCIPVFVFISAWQAAVNCG
jgi:hypothetical protein